MTAHLRVVFRLLEGIPIALFPEEVCDPHGHITSYMRVGQHGAACPSLVDELPHATPEQYAPLLEEIQRIYEDSSPAYGGPVAVIVSEEPLNEEP